MARLQKIRGTKNLADYQGHNVSDKISFHNINNEKLLEIENLEIR
jgi:hypothetical protein